MYCAYLQSLICIYPPKYNSIDFIFPPKLLKTFFAFRHRRLIWKKLRRKMLRFCKVNKQQVESDGDFDRQRYIERYGATKDTKVTTSLGFQSRRVTFFRQLYSFPAQNSETIEQTLEKCTHSIIHDIGRLLTN